MTSESTTRSLAALISTISSPDPDSIYEKQATHRIDNLLVPKGSLGDLARLATRIARIKGTAKPCLFKRSLLIFAADHGVTDENISAYPADITAIVCRSLANGAAAASVLARASLCDMEVIDVGVKSSLSDLTQITHRKIAFGTQNLARGRAASRAETLRAIEIGAERADQYKTSDIMILGEVGIGNTTSAAAVFCALTGEDPRVIVGRGSGITDETLEHKIRIVQQSLDLHSSSFIDPIEIMACVGGFEISAMAGAMIAAAANKQPILLDGFITSVAAFAAYKIVHNDSFLDYLIPSHQSAEKAHGIVLNHLSLTPLLSVGLRIGEGTGALLTLPIIDSACRLLSELHTFEEAGIHIDESAVA